MACRERAAPDDLLRLVVSPDGDVVVDTRGSLPGRGAWLHWRAVCLEKVNTHTGVLQRPLGVRPAVGWLRPLLASALARGLTDGLTQAAGAGALMGGHDVLVRALSERKVDLLLVASDCAERTLRDLSAVAGDTPIHSLAIDRATLGGLMGRGERAAVGVTPSRATTHLRRVLRRVVEIG